MADNKKKTYEELADEALDAVSGGLFGGNDETVSCANCGRPIEKVNANIINGKYYCSACFNNPQTIELI